MSVGTLTLRWSGILLGILFITAALSACGDGSAPEEEMAKSTPATQVSGSSTPDEGTAKSSSGTLRRPTLSRMSL